MSPTITQEAFGSARWRTMVAMRLRVLRTPLGLAFTAAQLAREADQIHLALWLGEDLAGTLLLIPPGADGTATLRQMAIDPAHCGRGLGRMLTAHAERLLRKRGASRLVLSARMTAIGFYERLGFLADGAPYIEVTIPHRRMAKTLN